MTADSEGDDEYHLYRHSGDNEGVPQVKYGIRMSVHHEPDYTHYAYPPTREPGFQGGTQLPSAIDYRTPGPGGQMKLFGMDHEPGESHVDFMESTKQSRIHAPTLLAIAQQDTKQQYGRELGASNDRSAHSEKLVQHLQGKMGKQFSERAMSNNMRFDTESEGSNSRNAMTKTALSRGRSIVPTGQVRQAQQTVRNILRPSAPQQQSAQPSHEQWPLFPTGPRQLRPPR